MKYQITMPDGSIWEAELKAIAMQIVWTGFNFGTLEEDAVEYINTHSAGELIHDARELSWYQVSQFMRRVKPATDVFETGWKVGDAEITGEGPEKGPKRRLCRSNDMGFCGMYTDYYAAVDGNCTDNENCEGWE